MIGGSLLAQGGYGCVFHPEINCKGKESKERKYISKIQKEDFSAYNEIAIGKIISENVDKEYYFGPIVSHCKIDVSKLGKDIEGIEKCKIINKAHTSKFLMLRIKYIDGGIFDNFILDNTNSSKILSLFNLNLIELLKRIEVLIKLNIVHFDLKGQNIIYEKNVEKPVIIDFGLSIPINKLEANQKFYKYFYVYSPSYYFWPLEVHYLNFLIHESSSPRLEDIELLCQTFVENNRGLKGFSKKFNSQYERMCIDVLKGYLNKPTAEVKNKILSNWKSWDCYSLSIIYLEYMYSLFGNNNLLIGNEYINLLIRILLRNIHPNPNLRPSVDTNIKLISSFPLEKGVDELPVFTNLIDSIHIRKKEIDKDIKSVTRYVTHITNKIMKI